MNKFLRRVLYWMLVKLESLEGIPYDTTGAMRTSESAVCSFTVFTGMKDHYKKTALEAGLTLPEWLRRAAAKEFIRQTGTL